MTREEFLKDIDNWSNHRILLWQALENTSAHKVIEMGCGNGSTPYLQNYCDDKMWRYTLLSYDNNEQWADKFGAFFVGDWDSVMLSWVNGEKIAVVLIDHAPGEHRRKALQFFIDHPELFEIIVIHDSEPSGHNASDYQVRELFSNFKYVKDLEAPSPKAWATALSNTIDVTKFDIDYPSVQTEAR